MSSVNPTKSLLTNYSRKLTNLSGNNRTLFLPRLNADQFIDLHSLSQLNKEKSFSIIEALIANKKKIICAAVDARLEASNEASKKLKRIQRLDSFLFDERGSRDLHIGWPFIKGKFNDTTCVRCPLLFFPVELFLQNNQWMLKPREDGEISFNKSFFLAYSFYNKVQLNDSLLEENFESIDRDSTMFRTALYKLLQDAEIELNFNSDNFRDELVSFTSYKKSEFEEIFKTGELKLFPEAVLGIFPQASSYLVPDYQDLIDNDKVTDLEDFFLHRTVASETIGETNFIDKVKEEKIYPAFPMDVWQENAVKAVKLGNSIVVQGPPGTGKSQLICNLISDAIANKQKVLVVCQKRAALDVVSNRLNEKKIGNFTGLVHDFKTDRREIYSTIALQIDRVDEYKQKNNSLDSIQLERKFYSVSRKIDQLTQELEEFRTALFNTKECGVSIKELYLQSSFAKPYINLKQEFSYFNFSEVDGFLSKLKTFCFYASRFLSDGYEWKNRKSFARFTPFDLQILVKHLKEIPEYLNQVEGEFKDIIHSKVDWKEAESLSVYKPIVDELIELLTNEFHFSLFKNVVNETEEETNSLWISNIERLVVECFEQGPELSIETSALGHFQEVLRKCMAARKNIFGLIRWELFSRDKLLIARALVANQLPNNKIGLKQLEKRLDIRLNLEHNLSKVKIKNWLTHLPENYVLSDYKHWFQNQQRAIKAKSLYISIRSISSYVNAANLSFSEFTFRLKKFFTLIDDLVLRRVIWSQYFTDNQVVKFYNPSSLDHASRALQNDFSSLVEFDKQQESLSKLEAVVVAKLFEAEEQWNFDSLKNIFLNSISLSWIEYLESKYQALTIVSSGKMELMENELMEAMEEKLNISNEILLLRARERVTDDLEFNRLNNRVTYRDLLHQVTKKKKIWPLRKLFQQHASEIFQLMPCWLASPETVSAIFPLEEIFDLVIFDEASQCFAESGIPAMYRGKQIIIAGDDQQLRPSDLYHTRWQEEDDTNPDSEIDSLLDLSKRYLLQTDLRYHYRSQSLALIDFSNHHFYKGRLKFLPNKNAANDSQPPIEFHKINGTWIDQTNAQEAHHIALMVATLIKADVTRSIGVITFNSPQQNLVQDALEDTLSIESIAIPDSLFVKNIENVQGDERDIIIFSIGYAPDGNGKFAMLFGSLNQQGGENRLNVAITRAKQKIIVVSSISPDQLAVENSVHRGPKILKLYLQYALDVSTHSYIKAVEDHYQNKSTSLIEKIRNWSTEQYPQCISDDHALPSIDIIIRKNKKLDGLLLTDDDTYKKSLSVKDRHSLLPKLAEQKNWNFLQLYSRNYWQDSRKFFNEVAKFITLE